MRGGAQAALLAACLAVPLAAREAAADTARDAKEHFARGRRKFDLAKYDAAIDEYMIAYNLHADPVLLYDIALCHRLAGHDELAVVYYKNYLGMVPAAPGREEVERTVQALERKLAEARPREVATPQVVPPPRPPPPPPRRGTIFAGAVLLAGGAALGASGGIGFGLAAGAESSAVERQAMLRQPFDPSLESNGHLFDGLWITSVVVGAVAAAVGIALIAYARRAAARAEAAR